MGGATLALLKTHHRPCTSRQPHLGQGQCHCQTRHRADRIIVPAGLSNDVITAARLLRIDLVNCSARPRFACLIAFVPFGMPHGRQDLRFQRTACLASQSCHASEMGSGIVDCGVVHGRARDNDGRATLNGIFSQVTLILEFHAMSGALLFRFCDIFVLAQALLLARRGHQTLQMCS